MCKLKRLAANISGDTDHESTCDKQAIENTYSSPRERMIKNIVQLELVPLYFFSRYYIIVPIQVCANIPFTTNCSTLQETNIFKNLESKKEHMKKGCSEF